MRPDLYELVQRIRSGAESPPDLLLKTVRRSHEANARLNLYEKLMTVEEAESRGPALLAAASPGPLAGVPMALKSNLAMTDWGTSAGSLILRDWRPGRDAEVVRRLREAGVILFGRHAMHEFAFGITGKHSFWPPARNPHDPLRLTGGSSSGSSAAVAHGSCPASLGTDTGGSVRLPAALCGIVGLKPTYGRVSRAGIVPLSWTLDHPGPLGRSVRDADLLLRIVAGPDPADPITLNRPPLPLQPDLESGVAGLRLGIPREWFWQPIEPGVREAVQRAISALVSAGATVEEFSLPWMDEAAEAHGAIILSEAAAFHARWMAQRPGEYTATVHQRLLEGGRVSAVRYLEALRLRHVLIQRTRLLMESHDLLLTPTSLVTAPLLTDEQLGIDGVSRSVQQTLVHNTFFFNLTGQPAISVPCGLSRGLPVGLQIAGAWWREDLVLRAARVVEQLFPAAPPAASGQETGLPSSSPAASSATR